MPTVQNGPPEGGRRIASPPSMVQLATEALLRMLLNGELRPGDRVVENRLTHELGISRPPLREALRVLEQQGLVVQVPRRGAYVTRLSLHDLYELYTLRGELERIAVELGVPCKDPARLDRCRRALAVMQDFAERGDPSAMLEPAYEFHASVIGISGHRRLEDAYRSVQLQMMMCMAMNRLARSQRETLIEDVGRHRALLDRIEEGDRDAVLAELAVHGDKTFLVGIEERLDGHTPDALAWLERVRSAEEQAGPHNRPAGPTFG
ncbi:MAG: FCD domain-containing protein [Streptosporangiales bacterium]|nr:FCD domain-containing protein [Streptosporangiales bacterium]